ncbi:MAG: RNA pseudouridine synthase [Bacteroidetes bacterium]|nr:MAG: RNA pseudouridine synthase [Bacteroidota bacterium]
MSKYIPIGDAVLWNDHHLVVFNKPGGVPVQPDQTGDPSLLQLGSTYCQQKLELVHRLDRPVSGVVAFAKRKDALQELHRQFRVREVRKIYLAITAVAPPQEEGQLLHYQRKAKGRYRAEVYDMEVEGSIESRLNYRLLGQSDRYFLWQIELLTGRYHQIRAQLAHIGCPIRGDAKYGFRRRNPDRSIDLHAWQLYLRHPRTREALKLVAPPQQTPLWQSFGVDIQ